MITRASTITVLIINNALIPLFLILDSLDTLFLSHTRRGSKSNNVTGRNKLVLSELDIVLQTITAENSRMQRNEDTTSTPDFQSRLTTITLSRVAILKEKVYESKVLIVYFE